MRYAIALLIVLGFGIVEAGPSVIAVTIAPERAKITIGDKIRFIATARYDDGSEIEFIDGFKSDGGTFDYGTFTPSRGGYFPLRMRLME